MSSPKRFTNYYELFIKVIFLIKKDEKTNNSKNCTKFRSILQLKQHVILMLHNFIRILE